MLYIENKYKKLSGVNLNRKHGGGNSFKDLNSGGGNKKRFKETYYLVDKNG
jgi:hypothetical protein